MKVFGIFGAGGCGRGILPMVRQTLSFENKVVFVDDARLEKRVNDAEIVSFDEFSALTQERAICLAVANPLLRRQLDLRCREQAIPFFSPRAQQRVEMDDVEIGEGALLSPYTTTTSNIRIGRHFHQNIYSYVEHDCTIGDFVTFAPAVRCNGNVHIGNGAYIGAGAVIRQNLMIGDGATIGMGAIVTKNVPAGEIWVGNPAAPLQR